MTGAQRFASARFGVFLLRVLKQIIRPSKSTRSNRPMLVVEADSMDRKATPNSKVLMITYVFPPAAWVGAHRTLKYCKYLGRCGWTAIVLAAKPIGVSFIDEILVRQVPPEVVVHRTFDVDPAKWESKLAERKLRRTTLKGAVQRGQAETRPAAELPSFLARLKQWAKAVLKHTVARLWRPKSSVAAAPSRAWTAGDQAPNSALGMWKRLKRFLRALLTDSPDSHIFWVPVAFLKGVGILLKEKVDIIYCSSPPHSSHIVAFLLGKCFRKPYILDFRDPWYVSGSVRSPSTKLPWALKLETLTKKVIVSNAAKVISVSRGERDELRKEFRGINEEHFTFITNGYDPTDFESVSVSKSPSDKLTLTHAGTIYHGIAGEFFEALHQLVRDHPGVQDSVQVQLLGELAYEYAETARALEATGILNTYGPQPHAEALKMVRESDILVILMGGAKYSPSHVPAKVFEYINAGKPILAIARDGELAEIVTNSGLGILVSPESSEKLAQTLWDLYTDYVAGRLVRVPNQFYIKHFERAALAEKLAVILHEVKRAHSVRA